MDTDTAPPIAKNSVVTGSVASCTDVILGNSLSGVVLVRRSVKRVLVDSRKTW